MASFHFVATQKSKLKLISMGIPKDTIFNIGALGLEGIDSKIKQKNIILKKYYPIKKKYNLVVSYHPIVPPLTIPSAYRSPSSGGGCLVPAVTPATAAEHYDPSRPWPLRPPR